jgi:hypothetical protein
VLVPLWSASPPSSFAVIQPGTGVPRQRFWIPIREMLEFQKVPVDSPPTAELSTRVASWIFWSWFREPLDVVSFLCFLLALHWLKRPEPTGA